MSKQFQFTEFINECDQLIRQGASRLAMNRIKVLNENGLFLKLHRKEALQVAQICARVNLPWLSLQLLYPYVRSEHPHSIQARSTATENSEYAYALMQIGATHEARLLLNELKTTEYHKVELFKAALCMREWNYTQAHYHWQLYLKQNALTLYEIAIAKTNLLSCQVAIEPSSNIIDEIKYYIKEFKEKKFLRLLVNLQEILMQNLSLLGQYQKALDFLNLEVDSSKLSSLERLYFAKWKTYCELNLNPKLDVKAAYAAVLDKALNLENFETIREIDFYSAQFLNDAKLAQKVFFGTPHLKYKARLIKVFGEESFKNPFFWCLPPTQKSKKIKNNIKFQIDLNELFSLNPGAFKINSNNYKIICAFVSDFYAPKSLGELFAKLFNNNYFNPTSSINRVRAALYRLNVDLKKLKIPFQLTFKKKRLRIQTAMIIEFVLYQQDLNHNSQPQSETYQFRLLSLKASYLPPLVFGRKEAEAIWKVSSRTANLWINQLVQDGHLIKIGGGANTKYLVR